MKKRRPDPRKALSAALRRLDRDHEAKVAADRPRGHTVESAGEALIVGPDFGPGKTPNYQPLVREAARKTAEMVRPGMIYHTLVGHDDWCPTLSHGGCCACRPTVEVVEIDPSAAPDRAEGLPAWIAAVLRAHGHRFLDDDDDRPERSDA